MKRQPASKGVNMISRRLQDLRNSNGYSQEGMAKIAGITQRTWGNWESEETLPEQLKQLAAIARHFRTSADYLLGLSEDPTIHNLTVNEVLAGLMVTAQKLPAYRQKDLLDLADLFARKKNSDNAYALDVIASMVMNSGGEEERRLLIALLDLLGFNFEGGTNNGMLADK
jgi:transcriptional regulator with XRE-family HTH domain